MYGYEEHIEVSPEQLLQKITLQQIFEFILKEPFDYSSRYCSPFREDKKPGCRFEQRPDGNIVFVDFGERLLRPDRVHRSAFGMVMEKYELSLAGAIRKLCDHFGLSGDRHDYDYVETLNYQRSSTPDLTTMTYERKPLNKIDVIWWSAFTIKPDHLSEDNVFSASKFAINKNGKYKVINVYKYCYVIDFFDAIKVYQPMSDNYRWITNCNENHIGNIDNLPPTGDELIVQKSYKDHRVLRNLEWSLNVIWFMNEGAVPEMEILKNLSERFKLITIFYDNDEDGIAAAHKLMDIFNMIRPESARMVYLPQIRKHKKVFKKYLKDPGEFVSKEGKQDLITVLKTIGINGNP